MADQEPRGDTVDFVVPADLAGERVDRALAVLMDVSRSVSAELIDRGVELDGRVARGSERVIEGSLISSPLPMEEEAVGAEPVDFGVLYEDADVIVVDKPPALVVHSGAGRRRGTLAAGLLHRFPELETVGDPGRWGLVHRLDKDTSGVLIVARTPEALRVLQDRLKKREIARTYIALAHGIFDSPTGTVDAPIGRDPGRPMLKTVRRDGKPARTHYTVLEVFPAHEVTLLEVRLETGRTHQIRVHLDAIGHPVVGDPAYGFRPRRISSPRIFLHASRVSFEHPRTGERMDVSSTLPEDLLGVLNDLRS